MQLTSLEPVAVKTVWPTEAHHFTPWLLDNGTLLSRVLGMDIELEAREYKVGTFFLDVIGREVGTGGPVIIENQYGTTNHGHLGQILTYAGGTQPTTIVWIAERFKEEHRAALEWLNAHTDPGIRFFGVRLAAVTLAGAPPGLVAPFLEVVVQPNDWQKQATAEVAAGTPSMTGTQGLHLEFWSGFEPEAKARGWTNGTAAAQNWWNLPTGTSWATWSVSWAQFGIRSELYFEHPDPQVNTTRFQALYTRRHELQLAYGDDELNFDELPNRKGCRIEARLPGPKITEKDQWPQVLAWMLDSQERLRAAVSSVGGVPTGTASPPGDGGAATPELEQS